MAHSRIAWVGVLSAALVWACQKGDPPPAGAEQSDAKPAAEPVTEVAPPPVADDPPLPVDPPRSTAAASVTAKASSNLGFSLDKLAGWYAIEGRTVVPSWAEPAVGNPDASRDDDLRTAWTCNVTPDRPCALGLSFDSPATVRAVRIYGAAGADYSGYRTHPRIRTIRVHSDAGWVDATIDERANHSYVVLDGPIETRTLAIEILETVASKTSTTVHIAELEVLGTAGPRRPPLDLDPSASAVVFETEAWSEGTQKHTIRLVFLELLRPDGSFQRLMRATSLLGRKGDRFLLVEKLYGSSCNSYDGSYILLDQHTRMLYPLGTMGATPARVVRHAQGLGFAFRPPTTNSGPFRAVVLDAGEPKIKYSPKQPERADKAWADWGFEAEVLSRGASRRIDESISDCKGAPPSEAAETSGDDFVAARAVRCKLDEAHAAVIAIDGDCGKRWAIAVVDASGAVVHRHARKQPDGRGVRLARIAGVGLVIEASRGDGTTADLFRVSPEGIVLTAKGATLALRPPARCDACDDRFAPELHGSQPAMQDEPADEPTVEDEETGGPRPTSPESPDPAGDEVPADDAPGLPSVEDLGDPIEDAEEG
jgi:hypothetical protein